LIAVEDDRIEISIRRVSQMQDSPNS